MNGQQVLFDMEEFAREAVAATPWNGAPLQYTTDYHDPEALEAAFERYRAEFGNFGCVPRSHMWHRSWWEKPAIVDGHELHMLTADTRCDQKDHDHSNDAEPLPRALMTQGICPACTWHMIDRSESAIVEAWHDHALPGWRSLPIMPRKLSEQLGRGNKKAEAAALAWLQENYPPEWARPGVPVRSYRHPMGGRAVPGRSPLGHGYDIAAEEPQTD